MLGVAARTAAHRMEAVTRDQPLLVTKRHRQRLDQQRIATDGCNVADVARDVGGNAAKRERAKKDNTDAEISISGRGGKHEW